jgi:hypothetical protein
LKNKILKFKKITIILRAPSPTAPVPNRYRVSMDCRPRNSGSPDISDHNIFLNIVEFRLWNSMDPVKPEIRIPSNSYPEFHGSGKTEDFQIRSN